MKVAQHLMVELSGVSSYLLPMMSCAIPQAGMPLIVRNPDFSYQKPLLALQLDPKKTSPEATEKVCAGADELIYKVGVERFPGAKGEMPFEIQVIEEPPAENADQLPAGVPEVPNGRLQLTGSPGHRHPTASHRGNQLR